MIEPTVQVAIEHRLGRLHLQANVQIQPGWTVLFGASGSGKSTLLRILAGLIRPDSGSIQLMGSRVCGDGVFVPAHLRPMRWAGQRTALFPNRTVEQNLNYGWPTSAEQMSAALRLFGLEELASARPAELSGGQQQRVAVARAAVGARDKVLLLDEPFSGLDRVTRTATIAAVRSWLGPAATVISVTHDVGEAFELGAAVIRMEAGHVTAHGPVKTVLQAEKTALQATLERGETAQG